MSKYKNKLILIPIYHYKILYLYDSYPDAIFGLIPPQKNLIFNILNLNGLSEKEYPKNIVFLCIEDYGLKNTIDFTYNFDGQKINRNCNLLKIFFNEKIYYFYYDGNYIEY